MVHPTHRHTEQPVTMRRYTLRTISPSGEWTELAAVVQKSTPDGDFRVQKLHLPSPDPELQFTSSASCNDHLSVRLRTYLTTRQWCTGLPVGEHDRGFSHESRAQGMRLWEICTEKWWLWESVFRDNLWRQAVCETLGSEAPGCRTGYLKNEPQERFTPLSLELPAPISWCF